MSHPTILTFDACTDSALVGGKAFGLGRLVQGQFRVPPGCCVTAAVYRAALERIVGHAESWWAQLAQSDQSTREVMLARVERSLTVSSVPADVLQKLWQQLSSYRSMTSDTRWAVRSSATVEDATLQSCAGQFHTVLGLSKEAVAGAIVDCWRSLLRRPIIEAFLRQGPTASLQELIESTSPPLMAVVVQAMVPADCAGVLFTRRSTDTGAAYVTINAIQGLGRPLVDGRVVPDEYVVRLDVPDRQDAVISHRLGKQAHRLHLDPQAQSREALREDVLPQQSSQNADRVTSVLSVADAIALAHEAMRVDGWIGHAVDAEWARDGEGLWWLQARPIVAPLDPQAADPCEWSRANFKETLPDLPSPLARSFLDYYMEHNFIAQYRAIGCRIPTGWKPVRTICGRPFINVTLMQHLVVQLRSDPRLVIKQMGGHGSLPLPLPAPLSPWAFVRAGMRAWGLQQKALREAEAWFVEMKALADMPLDPPTQTTPEPADVRIRRLLEECASMDRLVSANDHTFAIGAGVGLGLDSLGKSLRQWFAHDGQDLLNSALQGQGTVISAQQIAWIARLATQAASEPTVAAFFAAQPFRPEGYRSTLAGTAWLAEWDRFLAVYGHRAIGESDIAVPRHAEAPETLLQAIRAHRPRRPSSTVHTDASHQDVVREGALARIRRRLRWWPGLWPLFSWQYRRLCRFLLLRESNRHHLMCYLVALRRRLLAVGAMLVERGELAKAEDIFCLTMDEIARIRTGSSEDWRSLVAMRHGEEAQYRAVQMPDFVPSDGVDREKSTSEARRASAGGSDVIPISSGQATGPARCIRTSADLARVCPGDILVVAVLDPGLAPYFGIAVGLVAEMGGTLSHGAIIAREYGIPAVANVDGALERFRDGERLTVDGSRGTVERVESSTSNADRVERL
ncbi:MAG: PEP/pyruvate-binding domain-containing protein [Nitrospiraceae bacterium]